MKERPIGPLVDSLAAVGLSIDYVQNQGCLPLSILPIGKFPNTSKENKDKPNEINLSASISSQVAFIL